MAKIKATKPTKEDVAIMTQIHDTMWQNGWKLRSIGKRKYGWYFYIIPLEDHLNTKKLYPLVTADA